MGFFDFLSAKVSPKSAIALDIGTEFVKVLIFKIVNQKTEVVGIARQRQKLTDMQGGVVTDLKGVTENCKIALDKAVEMAGFLPEQAVIGIAGELVKGTTTTVHYQRTLPKTKITFEELKTIIDKVQGRAFEKNREILARETGHKEIDVRLVNAAIVDVVIDSVKVTNPIGFQGKDVSIGVYNAFAPIVHLGALQSVAEDLGLDLLTIAAEPYAVARSIGFEEDEDFSAIFIDIGGGTTDIAVVRNGGLEGTKMFALGGRTFTRRLSKILDVPYETAEKIKIYYSKNMLDKKSIQRVKASLSTDCTVWLSGVELTLGEFENIDSLPSKILLCGGASALPDIQEVLKNSNFEKNLPFAKKPSVNFIQVADVSDVIDRTDQLSSPQDITPMGLAALAMDFAGKENVIEGILRKTVESMRE